MTKKLKHLFLCLSICLSIGTLAPLTLRATARSRAPTGGPVSDQALAGSPARSDRDQAGIDLLTTTLTISQPPPLYPLPPSSNRRPPDQLVLPLQAAESYPQLDAPMMPVKQLDLIGPFASQAVSRTVNLEPIQLQITKRVTPEIRMPLTNPLLLETRLKERYHSIQPVRHEFKFLTGRVIGEVHTITQTASTHTSRSVDIRPATMCVVNSTADSGPGTLRQCLENAVTGDTITFDPAVFPPTSPTTISLSNPLPWIITDSLTIDASNAGVILNGNGLLSGDCFTIVGANSVTIQGLQILRFPSYGVSIITGTTNTRIGGDRFTGSGPLGQGNLISGNRWGAGVRIEGAGTMSNTVQGNFIGTNVSGTAAFGNTLAGAVILGGATNNIIGGDTAGVRNLISSNLLTGVWIEGAGTSGNQVLGNYIGTDTTGAVSLGHNWDGVFIGQGAANNNISDNLISSSGEAGVWIQDAGTSGNQVMGNYIGTNKSGTVALPNYYGVRIQSGATNNVIGGTTAEARNLISGNGYLGIYISGSGTSGNRVLGNYIGTNARGAAALGNATVGVIIFDGATNNTIGWDTPGARNLISGNGYDGVFIQDSGTSGNQVVGNYIGTNVSGTASLGNRNGVVISFGATENTIGGEIAGRRNLISGNRGAGVWIQNPGTSRNHILGNYIGTNVSGTIALGNGGFGVLVGMGATDNTIGGDIPEARNLISGNKDAGVWIQNTGTMNNTVCGNYIGLDASGTIPLGNAGSGVIIVEGSMSNVIGGDTPETRNIVSGNHGDAGVQILGNRTMGNVVLGNYIGTDVSGTTSLANVEHGVAIHSGATDNVIGGTIPQARNLISGNGHAGVLLYGQGASGNRVVGNYIGTNASGTASIPNRWGVFIGEGATNNVVGGTVSGTLNLISGNQESGIRIEDSGTMSNTVLGNYIGTVISGTVSLPNEYGVTISFGATNNAIGGTIAGTRNLISGNRGAGVVIWDAGEPSGNQVLSNYIGVDVSGVAPLPNQWGVYLDSGAMNNVIGFSNTIAYNTLAGVLVSGTNTLSNTVTRNVIHNNGGLGIETTNGGNAELAPPSITTVTNTKVSGQTQPYYIVEVFSDDDDEGRWFEGSVIADGIGGFTLAYSGAFSGRNLTTTATDANGNTSEFSMPVPVVISGQKRIFLPIIVKNSG